MASPYENRVVRRGAPICAPVDVGGFTHNAPTEM